MKKMILTNYMYMYKDYLEIPALIYELFVDSSVLRYDMHRAVCKFLAGESQLNACLEHLQDKEAWMQARLSYLFVRGSL